MIYIYEGFNSLLLYNLAILIDRKNVYINAIRNKIYYYYIYNNNIEIMLCCVPFLELSDSLTIAIKGTKKVKSINIKKVIKKLNHERIWKKKNQYKISI